MLSTKRFYYKASFIFLTLLLSAACTSKQAYQNIQNEQKQKCQRQFEGQAREDCLRGYEMTFEEYESQRQKLVKDG